MWNIGFKICNHHIQEQTTEKQMQVDETRRTELAHRWTKSARSQGPGKHGQKSLLSYRLYITLVIHFTYSFAVCLRQSVKGEVSWQSLLNQRSFHPPSETATCSTFPFTSLLLHRCSPDHCKLGKEKYLLKTAHSLVAELTLLWFMGLRQVYSAIRQCWHKGNSYSTQLGHMNWILPSAGSLQLVWHSGTTTEHPSGLAPSSSSSCDLHPAQASLWPPSPHTFHLDCSCNSKNPDVSPKETILAN